MPYASLKPCTYPGCNELVKNYYRCSKHRTVYVKRDPERHRLYDRDWQRRRKVQLSKYPFCQECLKEGKYTEAVDVHHVERHEGDRYKFLHSPLLSLCHACHSAITAKEVGFL